MGIGWIISLIVGAIWLVIIMTVAITVERKYIVRENKKINYRKTEIFMRWNVIDTVTLILAIYTIICVQVLNILISSGKDVTNPFVQFFTNQSQVWVIVTIGYLYVRVTNTLKSVQARWGDQEDGK